MIKLKKIEIIDNEKLVFISGGTRVAPISNTCNNDTRKNDVSDTKKADECNKVY